MNGNRNAAGAGRQGRMRMRYIVMYSHFLDNQSVSPQSAFDQSPVDAAVSLCFAVAVAGPALLEVQPADVREPAWLVQYPQPHLCT